jgi:hemoglobin
MDLEPHAETTEQGPRRSLYERVGGKEALGRLVDSFYDAVVADPELAPFFRGARMDKLRTMQREFLAAALGGPETYSGVKLAQAHSGLGVQASDFNRFVQHFVRVLEAMHAKPKDIQEVISRLNMHVDEVVGVGPGAG